jgi:hypothetical protein
MENAKRKTTPVPLRTAVNAASLASESICDGVITLGSFWPRPTNLDLQSRLVKHFKSMPEQPGVAAITHAYAELLAEATRKCAPTAIVRVLASGETHIDDQRPHSMLAELVADGLGATVANAIFFRTEPRRPMRMIHRFSGTDMLRQRINYVAQDLFVVPQQLPATVLLIDDIYNLGATARVYAFALKTYCGVDKVYSANLAATRFDGGKDGWGRLHLDVDRFSAAARKHDSSGLFDDAWVDHNGALFHTRPACPRLNGPANESIRLFAAEDALPCPSCTVVQDPKSAIRRLLERL